MAPQPDCRDVAETVGRNPCVPVLGELLSFAQDLGNTACRYVLFCDNQVHGSYSPFLVSSSVSSRFSSPGSAHPLVFFISCPMRKLNAPFFPFRTSSTAAGCSASTSVIAVRMGSAPVLLLPDCAVPANEPFLRSSRSTIAAGVSQGCVIPALVEHDPQYLNSALVGDGACFYKVQQFRKPGRVHRVNTHIPVIQLTDERIGNPGICQRGESLWICCNNRFKEVCQPEFSGQRAGMVQGTPGTER